MYMYKYVDTNKRIHISCTDTALSVKVPDLIVFLFFFSDARATCKSTDMTHQL